MLVAGASIVVGLLAVAAVWLTRRRPRPASAVRDPFAEPVADRLPHAAAGRTSPSAERRTMGRAPVVRPVVVRRAGGGADEQRTFALDLGAGGVLLAGPPDLALGEVLELLVDLGEPVAGRARVVRETPDGRKALAFEALEADDRARLERYVASS